eukprot:6202794-Pleurochrysis_carterae.AAC.2
MQAALPSVRAVSQHPPSPALDSAEAFARWASGDASLVAAATVLAVLVRAAWLVDYRELQPMPEMAEGAQSKVNAAHALTHAHRRAHAHAQPRTCCLLYTSPSPRDGLLS